MVLTVYIFSVRWHLCYFIRHVVSIVTTMHICSRACQLLTSLHTMFKHATTCNFLFRGQEFGMCLLCYGRYTLLDYPKYGTRIFEGKKSLCICHKYAVYIY